MKKITCLWKASLFGLAIVQPTQAASPNRELSLIFQALAKIENPEAQANLIRGTLAGLSGQRDLVAPRSWDSLRNKLAQSKEPEVVKLAGQLSQLFGDLSVSEDALKLVLNEDVNLDDRKEALAGLVTMRFKELPPKLKLLLDTGLKVDAIRAYSFFNYSEASKELISKYKTFDTVAKRATIDTLASKQLYAKALLNALRTGKIAKAEVPNYTARNLQKILGSSFDKVYG
jgi:hypothetical protein